VSFENFDQFFGRIRVNLQNDFQKCRITKFGVTSSQNSIFLLSTYEMRKVLVSFAFFLLQSFTFSDFLYRKIEFRVKKSFPSVTRRCCGFLDEI
jgi:hypothetical protein